MKAPETSLIFVKFGGPRRGEVGRLELRYGARRAPDWGPAEPPAADEERLDGPLAPGRTMSDNETTAKTGGAQPGDTEPRLLARGNPQIPEGDKAVKWSSARVRKGHQSGLGLTALGSCA